MPADSQFPLTDFSDVPTDPAGRSDVVVAGRSVGGSPQVPEGGLAKCTDQELLHRVQSDWPGAFEQLCDRYRRPLQRVAFGKLGDRDLAEDLVQECLLAVYRSRHTFQLDQSARTWLWTILLNLCRREFRRRRRRESLCGRLAGWGFRVLSWGRPVDVAQPASSLERVEQRELLDRLLVTLNETQADAIRLRFFAELSYAEIAEAMQCSLNTAKWRVKQGLKTLASEFSRSEESGHEL